MNVNWQNLTTAIQNGNSAYQSADFGGPIDTGAIDFYDHPMSNLGDAASVLDSIRPEDFIIGTSKWGGSDLVTE